MAWDWENPVKTHLHSLGVEGRDSIHASLPLPLMLLPWRVYLADVGWPCDGSGDVYDDAHMKMSSAWQSLVELPHSPTGLTVVELE